jgi:N utilization substance protein A
MNRIKYDFKIIKYISLFETIARVSVKDCIDTDPLTFVVDQGKIGKAIGKGGINVKKLEKSFNRKIKIVEFNPDVLEFIKNLVYPAKLENIQNKDNTIIMSGKDNSSRAMLIGREGCKLKALTDIVKRHFNINLIKVM